MTPAFRRIALALAPLALVGATCGVASADTSFSSGTVAEDGSSVTTQVTWQTRLLALPGAADTMDVRLVGTTRGGKPITFGRAEVARKKGTRTQAVRIPVQRSLRGALRTAKQLVVTSTQHYDSPTDADAVPERHVASVTQIIGSLTANPGSGKALRACSPTLVKAGADLRSCDLRGVDLSGADLHGVRLSHAALGGANLQGADLTGARVTGTSFVGANTKGVNFGPTEMTGYTLPDAAAPSNAYGADCSAGGGPLCQAIYSATTSLDLVFYQVGGPNVVKWLQDAVRRGVAVRVIVNSANTEPGCTAPSATDQNCAWSPKADAYYALEAQLKAALPAGAPNVPRVQFSSQNFNITHQKTIIVDAAKADGTPLSSTELPATAEALVSSGNLQAFPNHWGQYAQKVNGTWTVVNPDYLTNPSALCAAQGCDTEWSPRDFLVAVRQYDGTAPGVTDPGKEGVSRIEGVFTSDFGCAPGNVTNVGTLIPDPADKNPATVSWPETWSNGSTYAASDVGGAKQPPASMLNDYPLPWSGADPTSGYFSTDGGYVDNLQGNVRLRQVALINSAKTSITVYNEEMSDFTKPKWNSQTKTMGPIPTTNSGNSIVNALVNAARRGVKVTIIMANGYTTSGAVDRSSTSWAASFDALKGFGDYTAVYDPTLYPKAVVPTISLLPETTGLYIHGKAFVADSTDGWIGSINASYGSMDTNRELGVGVTNRSDGSKPAIAAYFSPSMIAGVQNAAAKDAPVGKPWPAGTASRTTKAGAFVPSAQFPCINTQANAETGLPVRTLPAPPFQSITGAPLK